ncbi:hypothetical protein [Streptomyces sp. DB-54]
MNMEEFLRDQPTRSLEVWSAMLTQQRAAREGYYAAVRRDLALPPGHSGEWSRPVPHE